MKYTWEPADIKGGRTLRALKDQPCMLGYIVGENGDQRYVLIDLRDGAVMKTQTKAQMASVLNNGAYSPETV